MRRLTGGDLIISAVLVVVGLAMAVRAVGYHLFGAGGRIAPGFMPFVAGLALAAFSAGAVAAAFVPRRPVAPARKTDEPGRGTDEPARTATAPAASREDGSEDGSEGRHAGPAGPAPGGRRHRAAVVFALTLAAVLLTAVTGFLVAFGLLILVLLWFVEGERPWLAVLVAVVAVAISWEVFVNLLQVPLPGGMLGLLGRG